MTHLLRSSGQPIEDFAVERGKELEEFYHILDELRHLVGGYRCLADCHGSMRWAERGVYFFFEPDEVR